MRLSGAACGNRLIPVMAFRHLPSSTAFCSSSLAVMSRSRCRLEEGKDIFRFDTLGTSSSGPMYYECTT